MRIAVIGTGYVGLSTGVCLAEIGHHVTCIDTSEEKIKLLLGGESPIYEPGLEKLIIKNMDEKRLRFTTSHQTGLEKAEVIIVAVGTPQQSNGEADLSYLVQAILDAAPYMEEGSIVVIKSTVPVGTNEKVKGILDHFGPKGGSPSVVSNPEFLRQGSAVLDTLQPDRIVIGSENQNAASIIKKMYTPLNAPVVVTDARSAEMIKYASNAFLATKISFINSIGNLCEAVGANIEDVSKGMGFDQRIGAAFLQSGIGYGGSCFPKDVSALVAIAKEYSVPFSMIEETMMINNRQKQLLVQKAQNRLGSLKDKKIAVLGFAFKPETDDMREAPSITIIHSLLTEGAMVVGYDPVATLNAMKIFGEQIIYAASVEEALQEADAVFLVTEWKEIKQLVLSEAVSHMKEPIVFDGRNCFSEEAVRSCEEIEYYPIGKPAIIIRKS
ncbi:UDP-glucose dehydrogenase family protein [Robertmurraya korlensis]|uniref:UDP-glucose dehydrogenase family protein n=1 Tax=Robertmurraya korlensis TaxID=519977 RepID=UPI0008245C79|nr:UDP-glucose/GDP-mannose dehydrogenase family protein [Robertmurraya korlensis]